MNNIAPNQPLYLYQQPMFSLTVSTVVIVDNGVMLVNNNDSFMFPSGIVKAGIETVQFAAVRYVKEQLGIRIKKDSLMPVDFRSDPNRSKEGNIVDIGFFCYHEAEFPDQHSTLTINSVWKEVNFESRKIVGNIKFYMDHETLLDRAIEVATLMK